jgi:hypothetical protein
MILRVGRRLRGSAADRPNPRIGTGRQFNLNARLGCRCIIVCGEALPYFVGAHSDRGVRARVVIGRLAQVAEFNAVASAPRVPASEPGPLAFWQLAAPPLIAIFLALVANARGSGIDDAFSRFWDHAMPGRNAIAVVLDEGPESAIPPVVADRALADAVQVPLRLAQRSRIAPGVFVIRLSISRQAPVGAVRIGGAVSRVAPRITGSNSRRTIRRR